MNNEVIDLLLESANDLVGEDNQTLNEAFWSKPKEGYNPYTVTQEKVSALEAKKKELDEQLKGAKASQKKLNDQAANLNSTKRKGIHPIEGLARWSTGYLAKQAASNVQKLQKKSGDAAQAYNTEKHKQMMNQLMEDFNNNPDKVRRYWSRLQKKTAQPQAENPVASGAGAAQNGSSAGTVAQVSGNQQPANAQQNNNNPQPVAPQTTVAQQPAQAQVRTPAASGTGNGRGRKKKAQAPIVPNNGSSAGTVAQASGNQQPINAQQNNNNPQPAVPQTPVRNNGSSTGSAQASGNQQSAAPQNNNNSRPATAQNPAPVRQQTVNPTAGRTGNAQSIENTISTAIMNLPNNCDYATAHDVIGMALNSADPYQYKDAILDKLSSGNAKERFEEDLENNARLRKEYGQNPYKPMTVKT